MGFWHFNHSHLVVNCYPPCWFGFYRCKVPNGSPLATMFKVVCAASLNVSKVANSDGQQTKENETDRPRLSNTLEWLNRAVENKPANRLLACSVQEVEDVKIMLQILPIFGCTNAPLYLIAV
ncbi:unnamed protein product [Lactuca virosa]|uniref:Uncharacterized protein n=1 Tax=Lactuca virosa TaxID=75947 RepID=A0AAU9LMJ6_9ASTR|nr:unnamed protein product [Lactuca virosa]